MVMMRAGDLGISGYDRSKITCNAVLMRRIEKIRLEAGRRMGLGDATESVVPNGGILAPPRRGGVVYSCYLTPRHVHAAHAVTGAICIACCVSIRGTIASGIARQPVERVTVPAAGRVATMRIDHLSGAISVCLESVGAGAELEVQRAGIVLTTRKIMDGRVFLPERLWP